MNNVRLNREDSKLTKFAFDAEKHLDRMGLASTEQDYLGVIQVPHTGFNIDATRLPLG